MVNASGNSSMSLMKDGCGIEWVSYIISKIWNVSTNVYVSMKIHFGYRYTCKIKNTICSDMLQFNLSSAWHLCKSFCFRFDSA